MLNVLVGVGVLNWYELCVLFVGMIVEKYVMFGEVIVVDVSMFVIFDLLIVWVEMVVFV